MAKHPFSPAERNGDSSGALEMSAVRPADIAPARRAATAHLQRAGVANIDGAVLVLSELVSNAVLHGGGADRILVACSGGWIHISVHDRGNEPVRRRQQNAAVGGRGLRIVDKLAEEWGSRPLSGGKAVWARVPSGDTPAPADASD